MDFKQIIKKWEIENMHIVEQIRGYRAIEYKTGFADGIEVAVLSLLAYISDDCEETR